MGALLGSWGRELDYVIRGLAPDHGVAHVLNGAIGLGVGVGAVAVNRYIVGVVDSAHGVKG